MNEWLYKAEQFFNIDHTMEGAKFKLLLIHFNGNTIKYFQSFLKTREGERGRLLLWSDFVEALMSRFVEQMFEDPIIELMKQKQMSSLRLEEF